MKLVIRCPCAVKRYLHGGGVLLRMPNIVQGRRTVVFIILAGVYLLHALSNGL
jgi:hypothetical protein